MSKIEKSDVTPASINKKFDQEVNIGIFRDFIFQNYYEIPDSIVAYRSVNLPTTKDDQLPLIARNQTPGAPKIRRTLSQEEIQEMPDEKINRTIGHYALSINDTPEHCEASAKEHYQRLIDRGASPEKLEAYIQQRGQYVARYILTAEVGLITDFSKSGHGNILLYDDVILEEYRDKDYIHKIDYRGESDK